MNLATVPSDAVIVRSTIDLAHNLGLTVVAEGVEDEVALGMLIEYGCDSAQGYLFSRPVPGRGAHHLADRVGVRSGHGRGPRERQRHPARRAVRQRLAAAPLPPWRRCGSWSPAARAISARRSCACSATRATTSSGSTCSRRRSPPSSARSPTAPCVRDCVQGVDAVLHAATLHKPHVGSHGRGDFVDTNVTGTLNLLEEAVAAGVGRFVFTSTTSAFGRALTPPPGAPAAWITEDVAPVPRNIYGVTKTAAEDLCELVHRDHGLPCLILRTSRFFPESDDRDEVRATLRRRQPQGQRAALPPRRPRGRRQRAPAARSSARRSSASAATSSAPPRRSPATTSPSCAPTPRPSCAGCSPAYEAIYARRGWRMFPSLERVYVNARARERARLGAALRLRLRRSTASTAGEDPRSPLAARRRREGLPRGVDRALHRALTYRRSTASARCRWPSVS